MGCSQSMTDCNRNTMQARSWEMWASLTGKFGSRTLMALVNFPKNGILRCLPHPSFLPSLYPSPRVRPAWWSNGSLNTLLFLLTAIAPNKLLKTLILSWSLPLGLTHRSIPFQVAAFQIFRGYKTDIKKETGSYMIKAIHIYISLMMPH